jgi:heme exporter protein CcmD
MRPEHAFYVWTAYALFGAMLAWDWVVPRWRERRALKALARRRQRDDARRAA